MYLVCQKLRTLKMNTNNGDYTSNDHTYTIIDGIPIDNKIKNLIVFIWSNNIKTLHSCQGDFDKSSDPDDRAYISFTLEDWLKFHSIMIDKFDLFKDISFYTNTSIEIDRNEKFDYTHDFRVTIRFESLDFIKEKGI